jgi:hypothetical protein
MFVDAEQSSEYREKLSGPLSELLADPFSELTRTRQTALLIAATISLLVSSGIAQIREVGAGDAKLIFPDSQMFTWVSAIVTTYFLITYVLGVIADSMVARTKQWSPLASVAEVQAAIEQEEDVRQKGFEEAKVALKDIVGPSVQEVLAEIDAIWNKRAKRITEVRAALKALPPSSAASAQQNERRATLRKELSDLNEAAQKEVEKASEARSARDQAAWQKYEVARDHVAIDRVVSTVLTKQDLTKTLNISAILARARLAVEIIFPITYAVAAIVLIIYHGLAGPVVPPPPILHIKPPGGL